MKANAETSRAQWSIGQMADLVDLPTHVLRFWEDEGLVTPTRDPSGYRRYGRDDLARLMAIRANQAAGMTLPQIRTLLDGQAPDRHSVLTQHLADLDARERALHRSRAMTEHALRCAAHDIATCPNFTQHLDDVVAGVVTGMPPGTAPPARTPGARLP